MASNNVFVIFSESDKTEVEDLIKDISNVTQFSLNQDQIDESTKNDILKCNVFVCCLSNNSSQLLFNIVKFARCVARKEINTYYIDFIEPEELFGERKTKEELNFFRSKTNRISSFSDLIKVNFLLELILLFFESVK